jgi:putative endonuclease
VIAVTPQRPQSRYSCSRDSFLACTNGPAHAIRHTYFAGYWGARQRRHLRLGERGESEAYFYLKRLGYRFVASNFRVPHNRGEIDLIGWDHGVLCFVEVKTRSDVSFAPPSTAVTPGKRHLILAVARRYLHRLQRGHPTACRFDILSIVPADDGPPHFTLQKGAYTWSDDQPRRPYYRDFSNSHSWRWR